VEITEVRIKLMEEPGERLKAFCSITFDDCFVVRDLKIIEGANGPFVAMPSRKLTAHCGNCRSKNHLRAGYCNQCGARLKETQTVRDEEGRAKLYADIAHPINTACREMIQQRVISAFEEEKVQAKLPGYVPSYDDFDQEEAPVELRADGPAPPAGPSRLPQVQPQVSRVEPQAARSKPPAQEVESQAPPVEPQVSQGEKPQGPHKAPAQVPQPSDRSKPGSFGAGIFE
jgi:stage V sporulation protein G